MAVNVLKKDYQKHVTINIKHLNVSINFSSEILIADRQCTDPKKCLIGKEKVS